MKNKTKGWAGVLLMAALLCCTSRQSSCQSKVDIAPGIGFTEMINLRLRFQVADQARVGFNIGWWPPSQEGWFGWGHIFSFTGDLYIHFAGSSDLSGLRPWFGRFGINYTRDADNAYFLPLCFRVGRELNIDSQTAVSIDAGAGFNLISGSAGTAALLPLLSINYVYRF